MIIPRLAKNLLKSKVQPNKVVLLYGPRRVGKTTLLKEYAEEVKNQFTVKFVNGENKITQTDLSSQSIERLKNFVGNANLLIIDEAQKVPNVGLNLKLMVDSISGLSIIASGSASLALAQEVGEPLTGRRKTINMYPVAASEIMGANDESFLRDTLENYLLLGGYPELFQINDKAAQQDYLLELVDAYLFRDILELEDVRNPKKIRDLLTLLAFQIGKEVSLLELGRSLEMSKDTVFRYLDLLEKSFVLVNVRGFSRNLRKEVTKTSRYYFYDNGVRNALINNFNPLSLRDDVGMLWENYLVMERLKKQSYQSLHANNYFWRTYDQKEIDWVEDRGGKLFGFEFCWSENNNKKPPSDWLGAYAGASYEVVNRMNFLPFVL